MGAAARMLAVEHYSWSDIRAASRRSTKPSRAASDRRRRMKVPAVVRNPWARGIVVLAVLVLALVGIWWRGPDWNDVYHAFDFVEWRWIVAAFALNLVSVFFRAFSWRLTISQALPDPQPSFANVFSAFGVGLLGNAVLPARAGALARVAVLRGHLPHGPGTSATLLGTVFAHRLFDLFPALLLVVWVLATAKIPHWAVTGLIVVGLAGFTLLPSRSCRRGGTTGPSSTRGRCGGCSSWRARGSR